MSEILIIVIWRNYVRFVARDYIHTVRATLDGVLSQLPEGMFARTHKSFAVSLLHLREVEKDEVKVSVPDFKETDKGAAKVDAFQLQEDKKEIENIGSITIPVSKQYYADLVSKLTVLNKGYTKASQPQPDTATEP